MPKIKPGAGGSVGGESTIVPAGEYILAIVRASRKVSKSSGEDYLRCLHEVCAGPNKGDKFWANLSLDLSKEGTVMRWQLLMDALSITDEIELGSTREGTDREGDRNIKQHFLGKPFKAQVRKETQGQYTNNDIGMFLYKSTYTDQDKELMFAWLTEYQVDEEPEASAGAPPRDEDDDVPLSAYDDLPAAAGDDDFDPANF